MLLLVGFSCKLWSNGIVTLDERSASWLRKDLPSEFQNIGFRAIMFSSKALAKYDSKNKEHFMTQKVFLGIDSASLSALLGTNGAILSKDS
jgi:hypothetical protein